MSGLWVFRTVFVAGLAAVCWLAFIREMPELARIPNDKLNHIAAFFLLAFLFNGSCSGWSAIVKFCILLGFGFFLETVQLMLGYREFSLLDLLADALGILAFYPLRDWALNLKHRT